MASSKDPHSRSTSQHRLSMPSNPASNLPLRQPNSRHHTHTVSTGSINQTHRVTRRKSLSTTNGTNMAAVAAALKDGPETPFAIPAPSSRKNAAKTGATGRTPELGNYPSPPSSLPRHAHSEAARTQASSVSNNSAVVDGSDDVRGTSTKSRMRRASEGSHLVKGDGKRISGGDLKCDKCGKGYKHSSCLTKHLWEHTPEWSYTSKLLISKHQQVQLLEAASVLVTMNQDPDTPPDSAKDLGSDHSSASPAASGSSGLRGDMSSTDTTPPPQTEEQALASASARGSRHGRSKRYSSNASSYSRSYQSAPSNSLPAGSFPLESCGFGHARHLSAEQRPASAGVALAGQRDEDEAGLAAAVGLLSCSFGTPTSRPVTLPADVPPVPPLPARFMGTNGNNLSGSTATPSSHQAPKDPSSEYGHQYISRDRDTKMDDSEESAAEDEYDDQRSTSRGRSDEDDDGVFGRMEE